MADRLPRAFGNEFRTEVRAQSGVRIDQMLEQLEEAVASEPHDVVVNLGTNDADQVRTHPDWRTGLVRMVELLEPVPCVVLVTVGTRVDARTGTTTARDINVALVQAAAAHPNFHVLDWNALTLGPEGDTLLEPDDVHLSDRGKAVLAERLERTVAACCHSTD
jgi:lysophospholipase L1-like esterase